jgi:hypothetical protein
VSHETLSRQFTTVLESPASTGSAFSNRQKIKNLCTQSAPGARSFIQLSHNGSSTALQGADRLVFPVIKYLTLLGLSRLLLCSTVFLATKKLLPGSQRRCTYQVLVVVARMRCSSGTTTSSPLFRPDVLSRIICMPGAVAALAGSAACGGFLSIDPSTGSNGRYECAELYLRRGGCAPGRTYTRICASSTPQESAHRKAWRVLSRGAYF